LAADYASFYFVIPGAEEMYSSKATSDAEVDALFAKVPVKASDERTFQVQLQRRQATFLQLAALWAMFPIREDVWNAKKEQWVEAENYVSTGPFKMSEWAHKDRITLVPNPHYYGQKPTLQKITLFMVSDSIANYAAYLNNERDLAGVPPQNVSVVENDPTLKSQAVRAEEPTTIGLQFNVTSAPFDNVKVRQAFSMAIDRETFIKVANRGLGKPAYSWLPPSVPGYQQELGKEFGLDPNKAKQTLAEAGYSNARSLPQVAIQYRDDPVTQQQAQFIQAQLKENLGVDLKLEPMEPKSFTQAVNKKEFQMAFFGWHADYLDPDNWLPELYGCNAGNNKKNYCNPELDNLMKRAVGELDDNRRLQLWQQAERMMVQDMPAVFLYYREAMFLVKPHVQGLRPSPLDATVPGGRFLNEVWIKKS
jgi:oligopeptide transport system substrate-binding protein